MKRKELFKLVLFVVCFLAVERFCHKQTHGFRISKILSTASHGSADHPLSLLEQKNVKEILGQRFYFLDSGGQCYAFISEDKKSVLKVFKQHHLRMPAWLQAIPLPSSLGSKRDALLQDLEKKESLLFESTKIAFEELRQESGLIYLHLNKSKELQTKLLLVDNLGITHELNADDVEFALQKKARFALAYIKEQVRQQNTEEAKLAIFSVLQMLVYRSQKGIRDEDNGFKRNMGFVDKQCIGIDICSLTHDSSLKRTQRAEQEVREKTWRLARWLKQTDPSLLQYYEETLHALLL